MEQRELFTGCENRIIITGDLRREILERYGCTYATLKSALEFKTETAFSRELRRYALERGGELWQRIMTSENQNQEQ